jgi:hypothetical protein
MNEILPFLTLLGTLVAAIGTIINNGQTRRLQKELSQIDTKRSNAIKRFDEAKILINSILVNRIEKTGFDMVSPVSRLSGLAEFFAENYGQTGIDFKNTKDAFVGEIFEGPKPTIAGATAKLATKLHNLLEQMADQQIVENEKQRRAFPFQFKPRLLQQPKNTSK